MSKTTRFRFSWSPQSGEKWTKGHVPLDKGSIDTYMGKWVREGGPERHT